MSNLAQQGNKEMEYGLVQIYTGDGKGKTTAALGQGIRCWGNGGRVIMLQFLKSTPTGEQKAAERLGERFVLMQAPSAVTGFVWNMTEQERQQYAQDMHRAFEGCRALAEQCDMLILDEIFGTLSNGFVTEEELLAFIREKPSGTELVLTGRNAPQAVETAADYVSCIGCGKHPMERGVGARRGIEY